MNKQLASQQLLQKAFTHFQRGNLALAEKSARKVLADDPRNVALLQFIGILCNKQGKHADAIVCCSKATQLDPASGEAHYNLGTALVGRERWEEAIASLSRSLELMPGNYDALNNLGYALLKSNRWIEAEAALRRSIAIEPRAPTAYHTLGAVLKLLGRFEEAIDMHKQALARRPPDPAEVYFDLGQTLITCSRPADAVACYRDALGLTKPTSKLLHALGEAQHAAGWHEDACKSYADARSLAPNDLSTLIGLLNARLHIADWSDFQELTKKISSALGNKSAVVSPFVVTLLDDPAIHRQCAEHYAATSAKSAAPITSAVARASKEKLRIAYVSTDFRVHPVAALIAGLFEQHDRKRFEVVAISLLAGDGSEMRRRLEAAFDEFVDASSMSTHEIAQAIASRNIDIAVDLNGYTRSHRCEALASRPAPIQVNYLGYPGTMGADWIDYLVADDFIIPAGSEVHYTEKLVLASPCYQVNDDRRGEPGEAPSRESQGLPPTGFVFACFNNTYKITPDMFDIWMRLLQQVPASMLWIYARDETFQKNLRREAEARGVAGDRIVFAPPLPHAEHMRRLQCADLFVDTLPYNAHTTGSDALWAGVPLVTLPGRSFPSRVAGSLLRAVGLPELIASSPEDYEAIALRLASDPRGHADTRARLAANRSTAPLFDTARFTRGLEAAYEEMWRRCCDGLPPNTIRIA